MRPGRWSGNTHVNSTAADAVFMHVAASFYSGWLVCLRSCQVSGEHSSMSVCDQDVMLDVPLYVIAHSRSGDKGNVSNISLVAYQPAGYELLIDQVTPERLQQWFRFREPARI